MTGWVTSPCDTLSSTPEPAGNVKMSLDCAQSVFVTSDQLVVSLRTGELYVITLVADSMRSVRDFNFERAASSVLTSCVSNEK